MPTPPEVRDRGGQVRLAKVQAQLNAHEPTDPPRNIGVASKVAVDLGSEEVGPEKQLDARAAEGASKMALTVGATLSAITSFLKNPTRMSRAPLSSCSWVTVRGTRSCGSNWVLRWMGPATRWGKYRQIEREGNESCPCARGYFDTRRRYTRCSETYRS